MNLRQVWTEVFQKPAGRLLLFLLVGGILLAFILLRREPQARPDNTQVGKPATQTKAYSFNEEISPPTSAQATPAERVSDKMARATPTPKPPSPIPQTIFATKEQSTSESFLPYGRMLRCELVNTVDSTNIDTPIIGLVIEDASNDGRLIIPAGTEVHGAAQKSAVRERIGSSQQWFLVFQDGRELPVSGTVLDCAPNPKKPDTWLESDGSAGLRGYFVKSDKYAEAKAILASMISAGAGAFPQTTTLLSPLGGATQINSGGIESRLLRRAPNWRTTLLQASLGAARQEPVLRPSSRRRHLLPLHHTGSGFGQRDCGTFRLAPTLQRPKAMKFVYCILLPSLVAGCATKKEAKSMRRVGAAGTGIVASDMPKVRTPETVKAYPVGRYTDPNFPEQMHERHTIYRREQSAQWNYRPSSQPYALPLGPLVATSNPSPSYFVKTNKEQITAQQRAYAESLLEENIALKKRIDALHRRIPPFAISKPKSNG